MYNSLQPSPSIPFQFPLYAPTHAAFLIGFFNHRPGLTTSSTASPQPQGTPNLAGTSPATAAAQIKRAPSTDASGAGKPSSTAAFAVPTNANTSQADAVANYLSAATRDSLLAKQKAAGLPPSAQAAGASISRAPSQPQAGPSTQRRATPNLGTVPLPPAPGNMTNETMQQYIAELKAAALRNGAPPPTLAEVQANLTAHAANVNAQQQQTGSAPGQVPQSSPFVNTAPRPLAGPPAPQAPNQQQQQHFLAQQQQLQQQLQVQAQQQAQQQVPQQQQGGAPGMASQQVGNLTAAQSNALPQIPPELRQRMEQHLTQIRTNVANGTITQEQANAQMKQLQEFANT